MEDEAVCRGWVSTPCMNENSADLYTSASNCENLPFVGAAVLLRKWAHYARAFISNSRVRGVWFNIWLAICLNSRQCASLSAWAQLIIADCLRLYLTWKRQRRRFISMQLNPGGFKNPPLYYWYTHFLHVMLLKLVLMSLATICNNFQHKICTAMTADVIKKWFPSGRLWQKYIKLHQWKKQTKVSDLKLVVNLHLVTLLYVTVTVGSPQ